MKPPIGADFAAFDAKPLDQFFRINRKKTTEHVFVFAHTFFDARAVALLYFKDAKGYPLGYDELEGVALNDSKVAIKVGDVFLREDPTGGCCVFESSTRINREQARRGIGIRARKSITTR